MAIYLTPVIVQCFKILNRRCPRRHLPITPDLEQVSQQKAEMASSTVFTSLSMGEPWFLLHVSGRSSLQFLTTFTSVQMLGCMKPGLLKHQDGRTLIVTDLRDGRISKWSCSWCCFPNSLYPFLESPPTLILNSPAFIICLTGSVAPHLHSLSRGTTWGTAFGFNLAFQL